MLNELALLKNGIDKSNPKVLVRIHKSINEPGKADLVRVMLGRQKIIGIEVLDNGKNENYWTRGDGKQNQFPSVKVQFPIRSSGVEEFRAWKKKNRKPSTEQLAECLERLRTKHPVDIEARQQCWPRYREELVEQEKTYARLEGDVSIIHKLIDAYLSFEEEGLSLLKRFDESLWKECYTKQEKKLLDLSALAMFADGQQLKPDGVIKENKRITLLLDVQDNNIHSAAHRYWRPKLSELLFQQEGEQSGRTKIGTCAISGLKNTKLVPDTFPEPKCQVLGNVKIFSRKEGVHTYKRYGKLAAKSYSLSECLADYLSSALQYLCGSGDRKGKTWDKLPKENGSTDLLIAFCRALSDTSIVRLVAYDNDDDESFDETDYEIECEQICKSFKGKEIDLNVTADFLILRKISKGVQKAIFSSSTPVSQIERATQDWNEACKNTPPIKLGIFKKDGKQPIYCPPKPISPKQFAFLFRKNYTRSELQDKKNTKQKPVPGSTFASVMELFLGVAHTNDLANWFLQKLLKQFSSLLEKIALEKPKRSKGVNMIKYYPDALHAVAAVGLLLKKYRRSRSKEVYMKGLAYKLGQFCAVLDEIHIGYCIDKRRGEIPNRLIGNQAYAAAVLNPQKALELTAQRSAVYLAWAKKNGKKSDEKLKKRGEELKDKEKQDNASNCLKSAKYAYFWLKNNCAEIHQLILNEILRPTPQSKAELLLGYLAGRPIERKQDQHSKPHDSQESTL